LSRQAEQIKQGLQPVDQEGPCCVQPCFQ